MALRNAFGNLALESTASGINNKLASGMTGVVVNPENVVTKFREDFIAFPSGSVWTVASGSNDIIALDGNAIASSYLVISKDPLSVGTESSLTTNNAFDVPLEAVVGLSLSQRVLGQEFSLELISDETALSAPAELAISSISQTTTTLTVTTSLPHNLSSGMRIGIYGVRDSRLNHPSLVVSAITSTTAFICTAGPGGTIASVTAGPFSSGFVYFRPAMGYARNGMAQVWENASAVNSSLYTRCNNGDVFPAGTFNGNQSSTTGSTVSTANITAGFTYAWTPSTEYRLTLSSEKAQFQDAPADTSSAVTNRIIRTQIIPGQSKQYKIRLRAVNNKGLTVPTAKIISASKSASTTATITTAAPHGLTTGDYIVIYGIRDQTNFANLTTATAVAFVISSTSFTIAFGASATATSYGGMVARVQGGNIPTAFTTTAISTAANDGTFLTLIGAASWTWSVGDYINVYGCRDNTSGADLGVDGVYKVVNVATTTLVLSPISSTVLPASFATTNAGGTVIKRTDLRIAFARVFDYSRERVEVQPNGAAAASIPAQITNNPSIGFVANSSVGLLLPTIVNDITSAAITSTTTTSAITPGFGTCYSVNIPVTATSGTNQTLDVSIEESDDSGTNWFKVYDFPRITATGMYRSPIIRLTGNRIRYVQTVGGSSPSFTRSINRLQSNTDNEVVRQLIDRTIVLTTLNSTTPSLDTRDAGNRTQLVVNVGAITTTAPALQLEGSDDNGASWYAIGTPLTAVASSTVQLTVTNINAALLRARVSTAGVGVTAGYVMIKAHN